MKRTIQRIFALILILTMVLVYPGLADLVSADSGTPSGTKTFTKENGFTVTVTYGADAGIKESDVLKAADITDGDQVKNYTGQAQAKLNGAGITAARFFDIHFERDGQEIEPTAEVQVKITLADALGAAEGDAVQAVHFGETQGQVTPKVLNADTQKDGSGNVSAVTFTQSSFSVTGLVVTASSSDSSRTPEETTEETTEGSAENAAEESAGTAAEEAADGTAEESGTASAQAGARRAAPLAAAAQSSDAPTSEKTLTSNGNGTYNLSLGVTGKASSSTEAKKADVIVVLDLSKSMNEEEGDYWWDSTTRLSVAKSAVNALASTLLGQNTAENPDLLTMSLVTFSNYATTRITQSTDLTRFQNTVNRLSANGGTNWEDALQTANGLSARQGADVYILFVSDGNPTFRNTRDEGSSWNGEYTRHYSNGHTYYGSGNSDYNGLNYQYAAAQAQAITGAGKTLYSIGAFGDATNMQKLAAAAGESNNYYDANDQDTLNAAFANIANQITHNVGYQSVTITDGLTNMTASALVNGSADGFTYSVKDAEGNAVPLTDNQDGTFSYSNGTGTKTFRGAEYTDGTVTWSMDQNDSTPFVLDDGYSYTVSFTVWPSQESYDLMAELKNGTTAYDSLTDDQKAQITRTTDENGTVSYALKTNTDGTNIRYKPVTTTIDSSGGIETVVGNEETAEITNPDGVGLAVSQITVQKQWVDQSDSEYRPGSITFDLVQDQGTDAEKTILSGAALSADNNWTTTVYIAPGLIVNGTVLESGHTYNIVENHIDAHYELLTKTYHPMLIDSDTVIYDGESKEDSSGASTRITQFLAQNQLKGSLTLEKKVLDTDGTDITAVGEGTAAAVNPAVKDETFVFNVTLTSQGEHADTDYTYETYDQSQIAAADPAVSAGGQLSDAAGLSDYSLSYNPNTGNTTVSFRLSLKPGERFLVSYMPVNTAYSVTEESRSGYRYDSAACSNSSAQITTAADGAPTITATVSADTEDSVTVSNRLDTPFEVKLLKTDEKSNPQSGAEFSLKKIDGESETDAYTMSGEVIGTITSGSAAAVIGDLPSGTYRLTETKAPAGYTLRDPVEFTVDRTKSGGTGDSSPVATTATSVKVSQETGNANSYVMTITDQQIYQLPEAGGPGIYWNVIAGTLIAMIFAYAGFRVRSKKERRNR